MELFARQKQFVSELEINMFNELRKSIESNDFVLREYIVEKQLYEQGIDGDGKRLEGYARTTIRIKISKGQPADRTTTRDEGDFHASIQIDAFSDRFVVSSDVEYDKYILKRYGRNVLKITNENFEEFIFDFFIPNFKEYVNNEFAK